MKADDELIDYLKTRYALKKELEESNDPHGDDRFKHILFKGEASAFREILMVLVIQKEDRKDKCIHPNCECLDYCEAHDPYSKTPIEKATPKRG